VIHILYRNITRTEAIEIISRWPLTVAVYVVIKFPTESYEMIIPRSDNPVKLVTNGCLVIDSDDLKRGVILVSAGGFGRYCVLIAPPRQYSVVIPLTYIESMALIEKETLMGII